METLLDAINRLAREGYRDQFRAEFGGLRAIQNQRVFKPEELEVEETVRFEGTSEPSDEVIVFALVDKKHSVRGTFCAGFGSNTTFIDGEMIRRLRNIA